MATQQIHASCFTILFFHEMRIELPGIRVNISVEPLCTALCSEFSIFCLISVPAMKNLLALSLTLIIERRMKFQLNFLNETNHFDGESRLSNLGSWNTFNCIVLGILKIIRVINKCPRA